ncbi:MAG: GldG family protein [Magnetococcales bacterium]|nr:GldG family protein [Magnetococcales bacterium]
MTSREIPQNRGGLFLLGLLAPILLAAGGAIYAITGELSNLALAILWAGALSLLLFFYTQFETIQRFIGRRSTKYGVNTFFMVAIFLVIVTLVGVMSVRYKARIDLTQTERYSLSPQTVKVLKSLDREVEAIAFYRSDERTRQAMHDLLKEYSYHSPNFNFWFVDPDKKPAESAKYGVTSYRTTLIRSDGKQEIVGFESENKVTNALLKVIRDEIKTIYFLTGHGEKGIADKAQNGYAAVKEALEKEHHVVKELALSQNPEVPKDASVVVIAGPQADLMPSEMERIDAYVRQGGRLLVLADPGPLPVLTSILEGYGFTLNEDIVIDNQSQMFGANYLTPVIGGYHKEHPITREFNIFTFFPVARSVSVVEDPGLGRFNLAHTSTGSFAVIGGELEEDNPEFDETKHTKGPLTVAAVAGVRVEGGDISGEGEGLNKFGKVVLFGDSDFAANGLIQSAGNRDLFLNTVDWLAEEAALIAVRHKEPGLTPLTLTGTQGKLVFWLSVIIMPTFVLALGAGFLARRRRVG